MTINKSKDRPVGKSGPETAGPKIPGRGARSNASGRFEPIAYEAFDDGWDRAEEDLPPLRTTVFIDGTRTIIARNQSPDISFDQSINPYRGCEHGCIYCYARPSHAYLGLSPGLDFESNLFAKPDAAALLDEELRKPGYKPSTIALGSNTDPYQPLERRMEITRSILQTLSDFHHPVGIVTKSNLIVRDLDILAPMAERNLARAALSVTTLDRKLARAMEPRAPTPHKRLEAIKALHEAGVPVAVMVAPIIPGLNDHEMEAILDAAAEAGAVSAHYVLLRLPHEIKTLFREWLETEVPDRANRVFSLIRQLRGGKDYDAQWGTRMTGTGSIAAFIARRFRIAIRQRGLDTPSTPLDKSLFRPPPRAGDQLPLL